MRAALAEHVHQRRRGNQRHRPLQRLGLDGLQQVLQRHLVQRDRLLQQSRQPRLAPRGAQVLHPLAIGRRRRGQRALQHRLHVGETREAERLGQPHQHRGLYAGGPAKLGDGGQRGLVGMVQDMPRRLPQPRAEGGKALPHRFEQAIALRTRGHRRLHWRAESESHFPAFRNLKYFSIAPKVGGRQDELWSKPMPCQLDAMPMPGVPER